MLPDKRKESVRSLHRAQRNERVKQSDRVLKEFLPKAIEHFANGSEIDPEKIRFQIEKVQAGTFQSDLFRLASLTWSVPVSNGYGRRLRYLVWDTYHEKLAGIFALGDPVFNLSVRDTRIGWDADDRGERLVNILDAYVLGALPPYNMLLGGKAVACLVRSRDVYSDFLEAYGDTTGLISKKEKHARLLAVTTSSSMGRSSVYNRLKLDGVQYFEPIGYTSGWGHFHITDALFSQMREFLRLRDHKYADEHQYGKGPNWRLRTIRAALSELGINESVMRHGIRRQVFLSELAENSSEILASGQGTPDISSLRTVREISDLALERWIIPRASRRPEFKDWRSSEIPKLIIGDSSISLRSRAA